ncbi:MAG: DUF3429 domain-containing protein [Cellvibrionaceae bacterium]|nr:DUF3429 domain-containing protein [Cellvibrionaceae bacterium]
MRRLYSDLMLAGALPFVCCALALQFGLWELPLLGSSQTVLAVYGLVIGSFMAGSYWGLYLPQPGKTYLALFSNAIAIVLWLAYLLLPFVGQLSVYCLVFLSMLLLDSKLAAGGLISAHYFAMRRLITLLVVASLILAAWVA